MSGQKRFSDGIVKFGLMTIMMSGMIMGQRNPIGTWKTYTDMKPVRTISTSGTSIVAATSGGLFRLNPAESSIDQFRVSNGLSSNDLTAVLGTDAETVFVGASDGFVDVINLVTGDRFAISDINSSGRVQKAIRSFLLDGDSLLIGTDFGVSVYLLSRREFGDTYANFGFANQTGVNQSLIEGGWIWVVTDQGVARAPRNNPNLSSPTAWTRFDAASGLPNLTVKAIVSYHDTIVVGTATGTAYYDGNRFQGVVSTVGYPIEDMEITNDSLYVLWNEGGLARVGMMTTAAGQLTLVAANANAAGTALEIPGGSAIWIGTSTRGLAQWQSAQWSYHVPDGPQSDLFISLMVSPGGVVWCGSGANGSGKGFYRFHPSLPTGQQWRNFTVGEYPLLTANDYYKVSGGRNGRVWASSWGYGVVEVAGDSIMRKINESTVPSLAAAEPQDPDWVVVGAVQTDQNGQEWMLAYQAIDGNYLNRLETDTTFVRYTNAITPSEGRFTSMVIDEYGTKWMANSESFNKSATGLYYFNENKVVSGTSSTNGWGRMSLSDGLPNMTVLSLAVDIEGAVCVGTDLGMMIITDPLYPKQRRITSFPLREQVIQAIAVDAVNNKWIGTKEGIFVVNPDGTQLLEHHTVSTSMGNLPSNDVRALAIDQDNGILYAGTEKGLSALTIAPVVVSRKYSTLEIAPNPLQLPSAVPLMIRNLVADSRIKILTVDGALVSEFRAEGGGRAFWDGRDMRGDLVSSGVYFIVAFTQDGEEVTSGKVAVIRR